VKVRKLSYLILPLSIKPFCTGHIQDIWCIYLLWLWMLIHMQL